MRNGHSLLNKKGNLGHFWYPFVAILSEGLESSLLSSFHGYLHLLLHHIFSTLYEQCSSSLLMKIVSSLSTLTLCVCVWASHCSCVGAPTLFLSSCGFKNKLPHSLFQAPKEYWRVPSIYWGVCGVCAKLSIEAWNTHEWLWMHALEWDRVWMLLGVLMWAHQCFNALDRSTEWEVRVCVLMSVCGGKARGSQ